MQCWWLFGFGKDYMYISTFIRILTNWFSCLLIDCAMDNNQLTDMLQAIFECNKNRNQAIRLYSHRFPNREVPEPLTSLLFSTARLFFFQIHV
jgi:hypothetical protein